MKDIFNRKNAPMLCLVGTTAIAITVTGIIFGQSAFRIFPLYLSLIIATLQTRVNRYASLIGAVNSVFYFGVYLHYTLYGQALYALLFSFPLQLLTFVRWTKNKRGSTTKLRSLSWQSRGLIAIAFCVCLFAMTVILPLFGAGYALLDSAVTLLGILITLLTLFACIEYAPLMILSAVNSISLYISMLSEHPEQITYLIYSVYSLICFLIAVPKAISLYREQTKE